MLSVRITFNIPPPSMLSRTNLWVETSKDGTTWHRCFLHPETEVELLQNILDVAKHKETLQLIMRHLSLTTGQTDSPDTSPEDLPESSISDPVPVSQR